MNTFSVDLRLESDLVCSHCGEDLQVTDEVLLLQVVFPGYDEQGKQEAYIFQEGGNFKYEPHFFHPVCWEELWDSFHEHIEDLPPHSGIEGQVRITECCGCSSQINENEISGMLNTGELRCSRRMPNGERTTYFDGRNQASELICASCLYIFNEDLFEMWTDLSFGNICDAGLHTRCWRYGICQNGCQKHANGDAK